MNLRFIKSFPLAIGVTCASAQGFCQTDMGTRVSRLESDMRKVRTHTALENFGAKTASNAPQTNGYGFFATADFLWWKLFEFQDDYVFDNKHSIGALPFKGDVKHMDFKWEPGFRVGLGYVFDYDGWDIKLNFTDYKTNAHQHKHASNSGFLVPLWGYETVELTKLRAKWKVQFYELDLVLGRDFFVSKSLAFHPFFGLASAWINQQRSSHMTLVLGDTAKLRSKNNFWGIGPRAGVDGQFFMGRHFSLCGSIAGALLWGRIHGHEKEHIDTIDVNIYNEKLNARRMSPMVDYALGGAFETNFNDNANHFMVKLMFESQYWWKQN
ncbi:MAG: Lpg1974 family pore-forming outer membrane protein, partial [Chlamydiota bacterium]